MFKVNNKDTRTACSSASIVNFERVIADWVDEPLSIATQHKPLKQIKYFLEILMKWLLLLQTKYKKWFFTF